MNDNIVMQDILQFVAKYRQLIYCSVVSSNNQLLEKFIL